MTSRAANMLMLALALWGAWEACAKPVLFHRAADIRPTEYEDWIEQAVLTAKFHGARWTTGDYTTDVDRVVSRGQYEPWLCYWKLADHLGGDEDLEGYARDACDAWRDDYSIANSGEVTGFRNYTDGLRWDWVENANTTSRDALIDQAVSAAFSGSGSMSGEFDIRDQALSREVAYAVLAYINSEVHCGQTHNARLLPYLDLILGDVDDDVTIGMTTANLDAGGHIEQWLDDFVATDYAPFMGAITGWALIAAYDNAAQINGGMEPDARIIPKLTALSDATWEQCWGLANNAPTDASYYYRASDFDADDILNDSDPDDATNSMLSLNNMIAAVNWWLYWRTGESRFLERGDAAFNATINAPSLTDRTSAANLDAPAKQFNELVWHTIDGLEYRRLGVLLHGN